MFDESGRRLRTMSQRLATTAVGADPTQKPTTHAVDRLAEDWNELQKEKFALKEKEMALIEDIDRAAGLRDKSRGVVNIQGDTNLIKVTRRENVRYEKDAAGLDPLLVATSNIEGMEEFVTLSVREKGSRLTKVFEKPESDLNEMELLIIKTLEESRVVEAGKPTIKVEVRKS